VQNTLFEEFKKGRHNQISVKMASLKFTFLTFIFCLAIVMTVRARVQGEILQNLPSEHKPTKDSNDKFETLPKMRGSSDNKKRTLLGENMMKVSEEDDEDISEEGSGDLKDVKDPVFSKDEDDDYYLDEEDYEDDEDEDIYDDEEEDYSGDDENDDEEDDDDEDYDDEDYDDYDEEEDYLNQGIKDLKKKNEKERGWIRNYKGRLDRQNNNPSTPNPLSKPTEDEDLHFADDEDTGNDLNLSEDDDKVKTSDKNNGILYEYYNEFFKEDEEDYEEEDLHSQEEEDSRETFATKDRTGPSRKETISSNNIPSYLAKLTTSHYLLMAASALISFILFTIAFIVCCHQRRQSAQKKKFGNMPFVIDSNFLAKSSQKSHHPSNFVVNSSTSIVKNYQRVPTSTKEFLSSDSKSTSCSGLENPHHLPDFMEGGNGETKKPLLP